MTGRRPSPGLLPYPLREPLYDTSTLCHCHLPGKTFPDVAIDGSPISAEMRLAASGRQAAAGSVGLRQKQTSYSRWAVSHKLRNSPSR
ncbi:hypothetical protein HNR29_004846 [Rhizobium leguminosarum]|nr:hypothetical protein [Rhizobium leguminosarum]